MIIGDAEPGDELRAESDLVAMNEVLVVGLVFEVHARFHVGESLKINEMRLFLWGCLHNRATMVQV